MPAFPAHRSATDSQAPLRRRVRHTLPDGAKATVHAVEYQRADTRLRVERLPGLTPLEGWCRAHGVDEAIVGGFYLRSPNVNGRALSGTPLGEVRSNGHEREHVAFHEPWASRRASVHVDGAAVRIALRSDIEPRPPGDLLQAGPLLLRGGEPAGDTGEGFSAGASQFDSDITDGRHPRAALGFDGCRLFAVAVDGRSDGEAGMTVQELAGVMAGLGAQEALNLDGGGSASLVSGGRLRNVPREEHGIALAGGRAVATALIFEPR